MIRTRFAPSPTGLPESIHLGFVIRALWNYALAKKNGGQFVLRIEDTDQKRSRKDTEEAIYISLKQFGINWDEGPDVGGPYGPYRQSERLEKYQQAAKLLVEKDYAYYDFDAAVREKEEIKESYESKEFTDQLKIRPAARSVSSAESQKRLEAGEPYVIRAKIPEDKVFEFTDWILKKKIRVLGKEVSDLILLKSDGFPTYHLAVVVDDIAMQISHVLRGQEWISSTPVHLFIYEGLGYPVPEIGHFTVILDPATGKKFSKRDMEGKFGIKHWLDRGYLPEAILNYLMLLGWAPKDDRELFTLDEFVQTFDQAGLQKSNPIFDEKKLNWFNGQYIRQTPHDQLLQLIKPKLEYETTDDKLTDIIPLVKERVSTLADMVDMMRFFFIAPELQAVNQEHVQAARQVLGKATWEKTDIETALLDEVKAHDWKTGDFFMSLRLAIAGSKVTPPLTESMLILGQSETLARLSAHAQNETQT
ncbi:MAG: glutamate--tRNA ligase [bacterium]|nr:glutamate--tRNA ligase [bacterium]